MSKENKLVLVLGGARSGKSEFAEKFVLHAGSLCGYIATAEILDEEMAERVKLHKARRNGGTCEAAQSPPGKTLDHL